MKPEVSIPHSLGPLIIPILSRINAMPRIDTYFFKIHTHFVYPSTPRPSALSEDG
jgi:hypothetical protein